VSSNRRRQLAALARRSTTAALAGRPDRLRYPALLWFCHVQAVRLLDEILDRTDQAVGEAHGPALLELRDLKAQTATAANEKVALFDLLVGLLLDDSVADDEVRTRAWEAMAPERWAAAREQGTNPVGAASGSIPPTGRVEVAQHLDRVDERPRRRNAFEMQRWYEAPQVCVIRPCSRRLREQPRHGPERHPRWGS
jgi:hypothetical protein